jgi:hypothetical protein
MKIRIICVIVAKELLKGDLKKALNKRHSQGSAPALKMRQPSTEMAFFAWDSVV